MCRMNPSGERKEAGVSVTNIFQSRFILTKLLLMAFVLFGAAWVTTVNAQQENSNPSQTNLDSMAPASTLTTDTVDESSKPETKQEEDPEPGSTEAVPNFLTEATLTEVTTKVRDPKSYGLWVVAPAVVAIVLAIFARQVVLALFVGILVGSFMLVPCLHPDAPFAGGNFLLTGLRLTAETFLVGAINDPTSDYGHLKIMIFTLFIGFMVGVIGRNGGTAGMVQLVSGRTESPRRGALTAWFGGLVIFFDDYANMMIIGPTMRPVFDRLKISRAKLAYIIDSTAAPVASIALIGTWVGTEISLIDTGLADLQKTGMPAFLVDAQGEVMSGMTVFLESLKYRFYPILALFMVFLVALFGRDFGPMKKSQDNAARKILTSGLVKEPDASSEPSVVPKWWLGVMPILMLVSVTLIILVQTGLEGAATDPLLKLETTAWWHKASIVIGKGDSYLSIFYGALMSAIVAVILTAVSRSVKLKESVDAGLEGMSKMFPAIVILILAWALSAVEQQLQLSNIVSAELKAAQFPIQWLPLIVFLSSAGVSFATGSSWGTMAILCPVAVPLAATLGLGVEASEALPMFFATIGSVLAGSVFGDHCSPISDTTVLSSIAADCPHEEHVWTQLPYAVLTAIAAMGLGDIMCSVYKQPWYIGLGSGAALLLFVVIAVGRPPKPSYELIASTDYASTD